MLFLLVLRYRKNPLFSGCGTSPGNGGRERASSPIRGGSILITSAPMSASILPHIGPETICANSTTLRSSRARLAKTTTPSRAVSAPTIAHILNYRELASGFDRCGQRCKNDPLRVQVNVQEIASRMDAGIQADAPCVVKPRRPNETAMRASKSALAFVP